MACDCLSCRIAAAITDHAKKARPVLADGTAVVVSFEALAALASNAAGIIASHADGPDRVEAIASLLGCLTKALNSSGVEANMSLTVEDPDARAGVLH